MKRIVSLVWIAMIMSALVLASALPALAAPPTFEASCFGPMSGETFMSANPQDYKDINALYRNCQNAGLTASRDITPNPGPRP